MIVILIPKGGIGAGKPLTLDAAQVLVCQDNGTPIMVAAEYGQENTQKVSKAGDEDFNRVLRDLGINRTVVVDTLRMPKPPPGARLILGPRPHE